MEARSYIQRKGFDCRSEAITFFIRTVVQGLRSGITIDGREEYVDTVLATLSHNYANKKVPKSDIIRDAMLFIASMR